MTPHFLHHLKDAAGITPERILVSPRVYLWPTPLKTKIRTWLFRTAIFVPQGLCATRGRVAYPVQTTKSVLIGRR